MTTLPWPSAHEQPDREPYPLSRQFAHADLSPVQESPTSFRFVPERLLVVVGTVAPTEAGWRVLRVSQAEVNNGVALDKVCRALGDVPQGGLF